MSLAALVWRDDRAQHAGWKDATDRYATNLAEFGRASRWLGWVERDFGRRLGEYKRPCKELPLTEIEFINDRRAVQGTEFLAFMYCAYESMLAMGTTSGNRDMSSGDASTEDPPSVEEDIDDAIEAMASFALHDQIAFRGVGMLPESVVEAIRSGNIADVSASLSESYDGDYQQGTTVFFQAVVESMQRFSEVSQHSFAIGVVTDLETVVARIADDDSGSPSIEKINRLPHSDLIVIRAELIGTMSTFMYGLDLDFWEITLFQYVLPLGAIGALLIVSPVVLRLF